ncbi:hypothetical protein HYPBUDRAFT_166769 [Hyphopichia burtonii NRRL Y-1933]|uniref:Uncharacterized protein n=1 Tax=Hyphopichia burtonii NRRL Y-1933 TaxID=984485 RepID=A0A1E4RHU3_9ASCO|nr:hypothetical protein HYPBUDRAFT_166769 [Hyphopichia burtonii NRRL Y-1933]ODV66843.1 hypothetical protein HYPBUDRAFT_166769 [Hyphopichia burtonii NRRL Y-1933]
MGLFTPRRKRTEISQGFSKYTDEINRYQAGQPDTSRSNPARTQSLTNGAGEAALAALRLHSLPQPPSNNYTNPRSPSNVRLNNVRRANSLNSSAYGQRSNSLRSYTYNPKPSYVVGQPSINSSPKRSNSVNSRSLKPPNRDQRLNSLNSNNSGHLKPLQNLISEDNEYNEEEDMIITTKTTKVVDSQGRVLSITTETIKTLPDGSNIIETTTKNISRNNSRSNSLRNNSLLSFSNHNNLNGYNLSKIDEDLQDFDYHYQLDNPNSNDLKLNTQELKGLGSPLKESFHQERINSLNSSSNKPTGLEASPSKQPLKSILKNKLPPSSIQPLNDNLEDSEFKDAADSLDDLQDSNIKHPYKNLTEPPTLSNAEVEKSTPVKKTLRKQLSPKNSPILTSPNSFPANRNDDIISSNNSTHSGSIKFSNEVETIPIYQTTYKKPKIPSSSNHSTTKSTDNSELYDQAMKVAMERVYGKSEIPSSPKQNNNETFIQPPQINYLGSPQSSKRTSSITSNLSSLLENKSKKDKKVDEPSSPKIDSNYHYQNHHKDFVVHSLRDNPKQKQTSRKERAKEEKKLLKQMEKQRQDDSKKTEKESKKNKSGKRISSGLNLFSRKKKHENDAKPETTIDDNQAVVEDSVQNNKDITPLQTKENEVSPTSPTNPASPAALMAAASAIGSEPVVTLDEVRAQSDSIMRPLPKPEDLENREMESEVSETIPEATEVPETVPETVPEVPEVQEPEASVENAELKPEVSDLTETPEVGTDTVDEMVPGTDANQESLSKDQTSNFIIPIKVPVLHDVTPSGPSALSKHNDLLSDDEFIDTEGTNDEDITEHDLSGSNAAKSPSPEAMTPQVSAEPAKIDGAEHNNDDERFLPTIVAGENGAPLIVDGKPKQSASVPEVAEPENIAHSKEPEPVSANVTEPLAPEEVTEAPEPISANVTAPLEPATNDETMATKEPEPISANVTEPLKPNEEKTIIAKEQDAVAANVTEPLEPEINEPAAANVIESLEPETNQTVSKTAEDSPNGSITEQQNVSTGEHKGAAALIHPQEPSTAHSPSNKPEDNLNQSETTLGQESTKIHDENGLSSSNEPQPDENEEPLVNKQGNKKLNKFKKTIYKYFINQY